MTASAKRLLNDALELAAEDRAVIAAKLITSLQREAEESVTEAWEAEIARRIDELDSGQVQPITMAEFWQRVKDRSIVGRNAKSSSGRGKGGRRRRSVVSRAKSGRRQTIRK